MSTRAAAVKNKPFININNTNIVSNATSTALQKSVTVRSKKTNQNNNSGNLPSQHRNNNNNKSNNNNRKNKKLLSEEQQQQQKQQQQKQKQTTSVQYNNNKRVSVSAPNTPQQRRTVLPVKARRVERRKEIVSITEALKVELESSTDSDDSDGVASGLNTRPHSHHYGHNNNHSPKIRYRRRSSSAVQLKSTTYAGPTFNNSPAPSALPIPAFSPATTPTLTSAATTPSTPTSTISTTSSISSNEVSLEQQSKDILQLLSSPQRPHSAAASSKEEVLLARDFETDYTLSEIQRGLRSMLRI